MNRIVVPTDKLEPGHTKVETVHVPLNRKQRRHEAAVVAKRFRDDLVLMGLDPQQCRRDLARWDGVDQETMPAWMRDKA